MCYRCTEQYEIKIAGSGTRPEIAERLRRIADAIHHPTSVGDGLNVSCDDEVWEDATLMTEIKLIWEPSTDDSEAKYFRNNTFNGANLD